MIAIQILNAKEFMSILLKQTLFDQFEVRQAFVQTFTGFEIRGNLDKEYFSLEEQESLNRNFCLWSEIRPLVFQLIKGNKLPKSIRIVFSVSQEKMVKISDQAAALFLNITFEQGAITCITGSSQKNFSLDKSVDRLWDEAILSFFKKQNIAFTLDQN